MKLKLVFAFLACTAAALGQATPSQIRSVTSLPVSCNPGGGDGGAPGDHVDLWNGVVNVPYYCKQPGVWVAQNAVTSITAGIGLVGGGVGPGAITVSMLSCPIAGNIPVSSGSNWNCGAVTASAPGVATELPFRNASTGLLAADSSLFYTILSHTLTVTNINVNGIMTWLNAFGLNTSIPITSACIPGAVGTSSFGISSDGNFAISVNGAACADIGSNVVPSGVAKGSQLVSSGISSNPVYQTKSFLDVRDIAGVDCTGVADSAAALTAFTGNQPGTNNSITGRTLSFGGCAAIKLATKWLIYNQAGFIISGLTRSGAASKGTQFTWSGGSGAMIEMEYVDGFTVEGLNLNGGSAATVGILIDKNGAGGVWNTTDGILRNNTYQGSNQNWIGVSISPVSINNVEDIRILDSTFYCNATVATTAAVGIQIGNSANAKNEIFRHNTITQCFYGIWAKSGSMQASENEFSANGGTCATGSGADIRLDNNTDTDIIEGNVSENSLQGINVNNDAGGGSSNPVSVRGNHNAPGGCENLANYWYNVPNGATSWLFEGNAWSPDNNLVKVIGSNQAGGSSNAPIYTNANLFPNLLFTPWWTNAANTVSGEYGVNSDILMMYSAKTASEPSAGNSASSPLFGLRGYLNGSTSTPDDFIMQNVPAGGTGIAGGTLLLKHQQGASGTEFLAFDGSYSSVKVSVLPTPTTPSVVNQGTAGATSYTYSVVAYDALGNTAGSPTGNTATGNATLTGSHYNMVTWYPTGGALKYCIWRTASSGTPSSIGNIGCTSAIQSRNDTHEFAFGYTQNVGTVTNPYQFNDTGLAGDSASLPASNTTGGLSVAGPISTAYTTRVSNLHTSGNPDLISCGSTGTCSNTRQVNAFVVYGTATLAGGTLAYSGLPFASTTWLCDTWDVTTPGTTSSMVQVTDSTHATLTGTGTDVLGFQCTGN